MSKKNKDIVGDEQVTEEQIKAEPKKKNDDKNAKNQKNNKKIKNKEKKSLGKKAKETFSELKKVTWPTFSEVCKRTGVVLVVVLIFAVIIFGMDYGLGELMQLLRKG